MSGWKNKLIRSMALTALLVFVLARTVLAESVEDRLAAMDSMVNAASQITHNPYFKMGHLYGAAYTQASLAERWATVRPILKQLLQSLSYEPYQPSSRNALVIRLPRAISEATLGPSRFTGFTQSETSTAWCGNSVVIGFIDTGSEISSLIGNAGVTMLGVAQSSNRGGRFVNEGAPPVPNSSQFILGDPSLACANADTFYYASIYSNNISNTVGVDVATSTDGGVNFSAPVTAVSKSADTDMVDKDWLAVDPNDPSRLYIVYADFDFSGSVCGFDSSGSAIPRYSIEAVSSANGGSTWSSPTIIEQVCANSANPNAFVNGPQVAVGPGGQVYVAWEAFGENGTSATNREIQFAVSQDEGGSFSTPVVVSAVNPLGDGADLQGMIRSNEFPSLAVGKGKFNNGFLYLAWATGANIVPDVLSTTGAYGFGDIMFSQSSDGGSSWSAPVRVNNDAEGGSVPFTDQFEPAIATDKTGRIGICFYDRRRDPNNFLIDRYCANSRNSVIWQNRKITRLNFPSVVGQDVMLPPDYMGDYDTLASDSTNTYAGFVGGYADNSEGHPVVLESRD